MFKGKDLVGQVYNLLMVISFYGVSKHGKRLWLCRCSCKDKNEVIATTGELHSSTVKSCGCLKHRRPDNFKDMTSKVFKRLTAIKIDHVDELWRPYWVCKCSCDAKEIIVLGSSLRNGTTGSCGCLQSEIASKANMSHGFASGTPTQQRFYAIWQAMKDRCYNEKCSGYKWYGIRGIKVCDRWLGEEGFIHFKEDLWESYLKHLKEFGEKGTSIGRKEVNGNYELSNVGWETNEEQARSTRCTPITDDYAEHRRWRIRGSQVLSGSILTFKRLGHTNSPTFIKYIGCSFLEFKQYIESLWTEGMSWDNYGLGANKWNVDHIIGCNNFSLAKEQDRLVCFNYKNLRPMWWPDHQKKLKHRTEYLPVIGR